MRITNFYDALDRILEGDTTNWPQIMSNGLDDNFTHIDDMVLVNEIMPAINRAQIAFVRNEANIRLARTAIAVTRYILSNGVPPENLEDCVPIYLSAVPTDPFTGNQLHYRTIPGNFILYAVFDDLDDDGAFPTRKM